MALYKFIYLLTYLLKQWHSEGADHPGRESGGAEESGVITTKTGMILVTAKMGVIRGHQASHDFFGGEE